MSVSQPKLPEPEVLLRAILEGVARVGLVVAAQQLQAAGMSIAESAKVLGVSVATLWRYLESAKEGGAGALVPRQFNSGRRKSIPGLPKMPQDASEPSNPADGPEFDSDATAANGVRRQGILRDDSERGGRVGL
jgi:hypothetical protein